MLAEKALIAEEIDSMLDKNKQEIRRLNEENEELRSELNNKKSL